MEWILVLGCGIIYLLSARRQSRRLKNIELALPSEEIGHSGRKEERRGFSQPLFHLALF